MSRLSGLSARTSARLLISFIDLTGFTRYSRQLPDTELADLIDEHYRRIESSIAERGGILIKFIGDAALIVFEEELIDEGVQALLELKEKTDAWIAEQGWKRSELIVKAHVGDAIIGPFASSGRLDVIGSAVNTAATLESRGFALSPQAFRSLAPETRKRFKKHTPPITYIRTEDPHP